MGRACGTLGKEKYRIFFFFLVRMTEGKRQLWIRRRRWEDNVKIDFKAI